MAGLAGITFYNSLDGCWYQLVNSKNKWEDQPRKENGEFTFRTSNLKSAIESIIDKAINDPSKYEKVDIAEVSDRLKRDAASNGIDLSGYSHNIDVSGVRHAFIEHGDAKRETQRGQKAINARDIKRIPEIVAEYDIMEISGKNSIGRDVIKYTKKFDDGTTYYLEEIRTGRKRLTIQTMYKK